MVSDWRAGHFGRVESGLRRSRLFLKLDGIDGDVAVVGYEGWIEISAYGVEASRVSTGGGGGSGKVTLQDFSFFTRTSSASPRILEHVLLGRIIPTVELDILAPTSTGMQRIANWTLEEASIVRYTTKGNGDWPTEYFDIQFNRLTYSYYSPTGAISTISWDLITNTTFVDINSDDFQLLTGTLPEPATASLLLTLCGAALLRRRSR